MNLDHFRNATRKKFDDRNYPYTDEWENLDTPLFKFGDEPDECAFNYTKAYESCICFGNTGSGKSSGVLAKILRAYMQHQFGMLLLTSKPEDADVYKAFAKEAGRLHQVIELKPGGEHTFNFMQYESTVKSELSFARNLQDLLNVVIEAGEERNEGSDRDPFWRNSQQMLIKNVIQLLLLAYNEVTIPQLYEVAQTTPQDKSGTNTIDDEATAFEKAMSLAKRNVKAQTEQWRLKSGSDKIDSLTDDEYIKCLKEEVPDYRTLKMVYDFFMEGFYNISEKTRGIITLSLTSFLSRLIDEPIYSLFCNKPSTITPESCIDDGAIVILNMPIALYNRTGQDVAIMTKYLFQKAWQRRDITKNGRPLAIVADEAQQVLHPLDATLLATSRSSRISTIYLSQNLPAFYSNVGGSKSEYKVDALLSLLSTKIWLSNSCPKTNRWASDIIGKGYIENFSTNANYGQQPTFGESSNFILEDLVRPECFSRLKCGGRLNDFKVEGYIHMQGITFNNGFSHKKIKFSQTKNQ